MDRVGVLCGSGREESGRANKRIKVTSRNAASTTERGKGREREIIKP